MSKRGASQGFGLLAGTALTCSASCHQHSDSIGAGIADVGAAEGCIGTPVVVPKRIVRLTVKQLFNSYVSLFGTEVAAEITRNEGASASADREFPPISGDIGVSEALLGQYDRLAQAAMAYVLAHAGTLSGCGAVIADKRCAQQYLLSFAQEAFRHPLSVAEQEAITGQFWTEMMSAGATLPDALGFGIYGILSSPSFIYRTELGSSMAPDGPLELYELASAISFFLTDFPPDRELLVAADSGALSNPREVRTQAARLLATPQARRNLENALITYFSLANARTAILNPDVTWGLAVTGGLQSAIYHEGELFLQNTLWKGALNDLLTSRETWTNADVAVGIYRATAPSDLDAEGFGVVQLSIDRAGLLTLPAFLLAGARPTGGSPVARGLAVNRSIVCEVNPPFPTTLNSQSGALEPDPFVTTIINSLASLSEREQAEYRANASDCAGCHQQFDAYGMVLESYDAVGRLRTTDLEGRPIDEQWTAVRLPESVGGALVTSAAQAAAELAGSGAFERCMAMNFINYALAEVSRGGAHNPDSSKGPQTQSCAVQAVIKQFADTERSFSSLLIEIAASETLSVRGGG